MIYNEIISGIYEIKNILNIHRYIGSSVNINKRFKEHINSLNKGNHHSSILQRAWNKYGESNFEFRILEKCEPIKDTLLLIEQKYLDLNPEYNICKKSNSTQGVIFSEDRRRKIGIANSKRFIKPDTRRKHSENSTSSEWNSIQRIPVLMLDDKTKEIIMEFNSITQAAIYTGHKNHRVCIRRAMKGIQKTAYGFKWKYKN